ncbi:MAG: hypothetical protein ACKVJG_23095 [Candidatus Latescibacterota bacterium]
MGKTHRYEPLAQWANDLADKTALFDMEGAENWYDPLKLDRF